MCNAESCPNYFSVNISILAVVFHRQISKNRQFCLKFVLVWVSIHCESQIENQDLQAGEWWWQNFNSINSHVQEQKVKQKWNQHTKKKRI